MQTSIIANDAGSRLAHPVIPALCGSQMGSLRAKAVVRLASSFKQASVVVGPDRVCPCRQVESHARHARGWPSRLDRKAP